MSTAIYPVSRAPRQPAGARNFTITDPPLTYTDAVSGTITLSGTDTDARLGADTVTGTIVLSGSTTESEVYLNSVNGTMTLTGSAVEVYGFAYTDSATGTITLSGSATDSVSHRPLVRAAGIFGAKPVLLRISGTFTEKAESSL